MQVCMSAGLRGGQGMAIFGDCLCTHGLGADQKGAVGGKRRWVDERVRHHCLVPGQNSKVITEVDLPR